MKRQYLLAAFVALAILLVIFGYLWVGSLFYTFNVAPLPFIGAWTQDIDLKTRLTFVEIGLLIIFAVVTRMLLRTGQQVRVRSRASNVSSRRKET